MDQLAACARTAVAALDMVVHARAAQHYASRTRQRGVGIWSQHAFTKKGEMRQGQYVLMPSE